MKYSILKVHPLEMGVTFQRPGKKKLLTVTVKDPALDVMTDFQKVTAITIAPEESIDTANSKMIREGIRLLFVVNGNQNILGLITATDILGEKPIQILQITRGRRKDITVADIMVPQGKIDVLDFSVVSRAKVGDIVETLKKAGRQHALVIERSDPRQNKTVRGIFSLNQIARQLGIDLQAFEVANTFAEIAHRMR